MDGLGGFFSAFMAAKEAGKGKQRKSGWGEEKPEGWDPAELEGDLPDGKRFGRPGEFGPGGVYNHTTGMWEMEDGSEVPGKFEDGPPGANSAPPGADSGGFFGGGGQQRQGGWGRGGGFGR